MSNSLKDYKNFVMESNGYKDVEIDHKLIEDEIMKNLKFKNKDIKPVYVKSRIVTILDPCLDITINFTNKNDYPNGIETNSCFFDFFDSGSGFSIHHEPHIYLSPYDLEHDHKYLAMRGVKDMFKECGISYFRKFAYKDEKTTAKKIADFVSKAMDLVDCYTNGYPYHRSELNISLKDAYDQYK